jgi:hypothetical protein
MPTKPQGLTAIPQYTFAKNGQSPDNFAYTSPNGSMVQLDNRPGAEKIIAIAPTGDYASISHAGLIEVKAKKTVSIKGAELVTDKLTGFTHSSGNPALRSPSKANCSTGLYFKSHLTERSGLLRRASAMSAFASSISPLNAWAAARLR